MRAEQVTESVAYHGEGPVWSPSWGGLRFVDMLAGDVLSLAADGSIARHSVGSDIAAVVRPRQGGGAVIGIERGFALENADGSISALPPVWNDSSIRMNEGACDPDGRFYCGSMAYDQEEGASALYRLDPDGSVHTILTGVTVSNGLDWSPDGRLAYYNDTATKQVALFDYDRDAGLTGRRTFVRIADEDGRPDGLTADSAGGVWVALNGGGRVHRYTADGVLDQVVEVPTPQVTACTLGGSELTELYITTSQEGMEPGSDPLAGALFRVTVPVPGKPVLAFAG
ncbi:SMP-30/gluconolactonase/LRE family protein [Planctomonas psychrotolerans]|uniref:SMP-30/gluconolactonase/LRE family protein n=1 Tax=Planctomonas psychrotolerans TaxID=2528712 RepID=UPI00123A0E4A|nr:SMP-30/gluconolactonase/LRE family protein [Planctomonas psychrotolerans]